MRNGGTIPSTPLSAYLPFRPHLGHSSSDRRQTASSPARSTASRTQTTTPMPGSTRGVDVAGGVWVGVGVGDVAVGVGVVSGVPPSPTVPS